MSPLAHIALDVYGTGGGCTALRAELPGGYYLLVTDNDLSVPVKGQPYVVGLYRPDGECCGYWEAPAWEGVIDAGHASARWAYCWTCDAVTKTHPHHPTCTLCDQH